MISNFSSHPLSKNNHIDSWLILLLITIVGIFILITENPKVAFTPGGLYSGVSVHGLTLSKNLMHSDEHFFMYTSREIKDGKINYEAYNRFPVIPFLLIGLSTLPFENNSIAEIYAARQLMNIFFFLSIIIVFKLIDNLINNRYLALSAALLSFSSYYLMSYNDMIFNDIPALLGFVLALNVVVLAQKKKLSIKQKLFYSIFPICLGWQPFAVYTTWILMDFIDLLITNNTSIRIKIKNLIKQPSFIIISTAIIWGTFLLGLQLLNEWRIVGGSFTSIPSLNSALWRSGIISSTGHTQYSQVFDWIPFLLGTAHSIAILIIPFFPILQIEPGNSASIFLVLTLLIFIFFKYFKNKSIENKVLLILCISGLLWAIPMRHFVALHDFQSIFFIGFSISFYIVILSHLNLKEWKYFAIDVAIIFIANILLSNYYKSPDSAMNKMIPQFQNMCKLIPVESKIYFDGDKQHAISNSRFALDFFLTNYWFTSESDADYIISKKPEYSTIKLTSNPEYNLFKKSD